MGNRKALVPRADRAAVADTGRQIVALQAMTVGELAEKYREVFGTPTRTRNKGYLRKHIAWRIQELAEGGLSPRALERIGLLAPQAPVRWRNQVADKEADDGPQVATATPSRDPRLPPVGGTLARIHDGIEHQVTVLAKGFEYQGAHYRSLSKIACLITGKSWNGYIFFLGRKPGSSGEQQREAQ
jgi:hypothetical protein